MMPIYDGDRFRLNTVQIKHFLEDKWISGYIGIEILPEFKSSVLFSGILTMEFKLDFTLEEWIFWFTGSEQEGYDFFIENFLWENNEFINILNKIFKTDWQVIRKNIDPGSSGQSKILSVYCG